MLAALQNSDGGPCGSVVALHARGPRFKAGLVLLKAMATNAWRYSYVGTTLAQFRNDKTTAACLKLRPSS